MELHHQLLPRLAGEALLLGQGAMPYRRGSLPHAPTPVNTELAASRQRSRKDAMSRRSIYRPGSGNGANPNCA